MSDSASKFRDGAKFARDSILALVLELKDNAGQRFADWAVEAAQEQLQKTHDDLVAVFGGRGGEFKNTYMPYHLMSLEPWKRTFENGAEYAGQRVSGYLRVALGEIGHANRHSIAYKTVDWLCSSIDGRLNEKLQEMEVGKDAADVPPLDKQMIAEGLNKGIVRLINSPHGDGVVCSIGEYWFYFGGFETASCAVEEYRNNVPLDNIVNKICSTLNEFSQDEGYYDEYMYYCYFLNEKLNGLDLFSQKFERDGYIFEVISLSDGLVWLQDVNDSTHHSEEKWDAFKSNYKPIRDEDISTSLSGKIADAAERSAETRRGDVDKDDFVKE